MLKKILLNVYFPPPMGHLKRWTQMIFFVKCHIFVYQKVVLRPWWLNINFSTIKIRGTCKIWALYHQNWASYFNFSFVKVMQTLNFTKFWNPEIFLKFWDFLLILCMWPLNIPSNKCYIATWGQKWPLPWFLRGGLWGHPMGVTQNGYSSVYFWNIEV